MTEKQSNVVDIFPTKIGHYTLSNQNRDYIKRVCRDIIDSPYNENYTRKSNYGYITHYFDPIVGNQSLIDDTKFEGFHKWIKQCSLDYIKNTLGYDCENVVVVNCWINKCSRGGRQLPHNHANSFISGTYFVNFVPGIHSPLLFEKTPFSNRPHMNMDPNHDTGSHNVTGVEHKEGTLLLWESHLTHLYDENNEDDRISISFNVMPETISRAGYGFKLTRL